MKNLICLITFLTLFPIAALAATPKVTKCLSDDGLVAVDLTTQENDTEMFDLKVASNKNDRPAESIFPTRENVTENQAVYTLLDSEFVMLSVDLTTKQGKLANGQFLSPKPYIEVVCE